MTVSKSSRLAQAVVKAVAVLAVVAFMAYVVSRLHVTYDLQRNAVQRGAEHEQIQADVQSMRRDFTAWLNMLWRTVYEDVVPKVAEEAEKAKEVRRPSRLELYQDNFNKDARARLERLERRVLELERQNDSLEK